MWFSGDTEDIEVDYGSNEVEVQDSHIVESERCLEGAWVDVAGAVELPGVYCLPMEGIVRDAVDVAGGVNTAVCEQWVSQELNRAARIEPNSKVYVRFSDDIGCGKGASGDKGGGVVEMSGGSSGLCVDGRVSINRATMEELETISGIGPATAAKIIDARPFARIEELTEVSGIGDATFEKMKNDVCL